MFEKKLLKDIIFSIPIVFLLFQIFYYTDDLIGGIFSDIISGGLFIWFLYPTLFVILFFSFIFGYVKYKTEKEIKEKVYLIITPFLNGLKISFIMFLILILPLQIIPIIHQWFQLLFPYNFLYNILLQKIIYYILLPSIISGIIGYYFYKTRDNSKSRKLLYYSLNFILGILVLIFYVLETQHCITFGYSSDNSEFISNCITKQAIKRDNPNFCLIFRDLGYGAEVIECVAKYSLLKKSPDYCKILNDTPNWKFYCYMDYIEGKGENFNESLCDEVDIYSKSCYERIGEYK